MTVPLCQLPILTPVRAVFGWVTVAVPRVTFLALPAAGNGLRHAVTDAQRYCVASLDAGALYRLPDAGAFMTAWLCRTRYRTLRAFMTAFLPGDARAYSPALLAGLQRTPHLNITVPCGVWHPVSLPNTTYDTAPTHTAATFAVLLAPLPRHPTFTVRAFNTVRTCSPHLITHALYAGDVPLAGVRFL